MAKCYMVVEVEYDPTVTDPESVSDALDTLMDTAKSTPGILSEYGEVRVGGFYPVDPEDIQNLEYTAKSLPPGKQRDAERNALANLLHRLGVLETPQL